MKTETKTKTNRIKHDSYPLTIPLGDKRPIAKFYRCYLDDIGRGMGEEKARGINCEQYKFADRLATNYRYCISAKGASLITVGIDNTRRVSTIGFENKVMAMQEHQRIVSNLAKKSREIIEHFCLNELTLREFELKQIPRWAKGAASCRLREALDELIEAYKTQRREK